MEEKKTKKYLEYVEPRLKEIQAWARDGYSEEEIAEKLNVAYSTFRDYKNKYSALSAALKCARAYDDEVINALHKNTLGGVVELKVPIKCKRSYYDENGKRVEEEYVVEAKKEEYIKPDTMAQMYWLNNRVPQKWKSKQPLDTGQERDEPKIRVIIEDCSVESKNENN